MVTWKTAGTTGATSLTVTGLPDELPNGTESADQVVLALISRTVPTAPSGWSKPSGAAFDSVYDPTSDYWLSYWWRAGAGGSVTFNFGGSTRARVLAFGGVDTLLDPDSQAFGGHVGGSGASPSTQRVNEFFSTRGRPSVLLGWTGAATELAGNDFVNDASSAPIGGGVDSILFGFTNLDPAGTAVEVDIQFEWPFGASRYDMALFEFGPSGGWTVGRVAWGSRGAWH